MVVTQLWYILFFHNFATQKRSPSLHCAITTLYHHYIVPLARTAGRVLLADLGHFARAVAT